MFYFIRHGETDYSERNTKIYKGFGVNLAPLSIEGIKQIKHTAKDVRLKEASIILSSPYTRALQTAAILSKELGIDIIIETDLHEWLANKDYIHEDEETADKNYQEFNENQGNYPNGFDRIWENNQIMKKRIIEVLEKYKQYDKVIITCHGMMIQAVTDKHHPQNGEIVEFDLNEMNQHK